MPRAGIAKLRGSRAYKAKTMAAGHSQTGDADVEGRTTGFAGLQQPSAKVAISEAFRVLSAPGTVVAHGPESSVAAL